MTTKIEQLTSPFGRDLINDLSALPENEDIIIDFLLERLQRGQIYTWVGPLLLALNPNNEVSTSHLYTVSESDKYVNMSNAIHEADPHVFAVATKAHYNLTKELGRNRQVVVISGETGTGKTFNAFKCLEFLSLINKTSMSHCQGDYNITPRITDACRLISAFTTACTERNEVSSRHGQLLQLHYKDGAISGATINSFLLERSRVTKGSSNFQIFYQMMFGMPESELEAINLFKHEHYDLLNSIDYSKRKYYQEGFQDTLKTLEVLDFGVDHRKSIFQLVALLIHMGNIRFMQSGEVCVIDFVDERSKEALRNACALSSLSEETVIELLTTARINPGSVWRKHTVYHRHLSTVEACYNRLHSIIRHLYDLLFHWVLNRANEALSVKHKYSEWFGVLDIFGFESFTKNGIEQLCVNYANEKMQQYFIETYVENSRKDLQEEGFIENSMPLNTINLYKERLSILEETLFLTLNDASHSPVIINTSRLIELVCRDSRKIVREKEGNFIIEHYSGPVAYSIEDLLSKNTDKIPNEVTMIFNASKNKFLQFLINIDENQYLHAVKSSTRKRTVLAKLKYNIDTLIKELKKCDVHYVRCVKPSRLKNDDWDRKEFRKQLASIGVFDALPLAKCKYPIRLPYTDLYQRYSKKQIENIDPDACKMILESIVSKRELHKSVHYGKQLIFLTESLFLKLETYRRNHRIRCCNKIKSFWRRHRRKTISTISNNSCNNSKQNEYKSKEEDASDKIMLGHELQTSSNSEDDDISITDSASLNSKENSDRVTEEKEMEDVNANKIDSNHKKKKYMNLKNHFKNLDIKNNVKSSVSKFLDKINPVKYIKSKHYQHFCNRTDDNNSFKQYLGDVTLNTSLTNTQLVDNCDKQKCCIQYDEDSNLYTIQSYPHVLFYRNGILSRRRLAAVPIRIYTRPTCLVNAHAIPRSELPQGLQDCL